MDPREMPPTLEEQMAAQARLRAAAGVPDPQADPDRSWVIGCLSIGLIAAVSIFLWMVIVGAGLAWWMWLKW